VTVGTTAGADSRDDTEHREPLRMRQPKTFRRLASLLATAAVMVVAGVAAPAPATAFTATNGVRLNAVEARLAALINQARTSRGIPALTVTAGTTDLARDWSMTQAVRNTLYHNPYLVSGIQNHGSSSWGATAENVGRGWDADSLFAAYMNSPGHRANILDRSMRYLGIGWVERPDGSGYNTQVFVDQYSTAYGHNRVPAVGGLKDARTPASSTTLATFESGWDSRVFLAHSGSGIVVAGPVYETPATGDQSVRFTVRESAVAAGGAVDLRVRDALDLRNATGVRVRLGANTDSGKAVTVQVSARRELGTNAILGTVTIPSGQWVTVTLPLPSGAKNFRNVLGIGVTRSALEALSPTLSGRRVTVRVSDVAVMV
jgi:uncharacterized protein YkwD